MLPLCCLFLILGFYLRLYGDAIFTSALGESGGASKIGSSWLWSEHCFWVGLFAWPAFGADPAALGIGAGFWFAVELHGAEAKEARVGLGMRVGEPLEVVFWWADCGGAAASAAGPAHVEVLLRLVTEPDFTRKKLPLSWDAVLRYREGLMIPSVFVATVH